MLEVGDAAGEVPARGGEDRRLADLAAELIADPLLLRELRQPQRREIGRASCRERAEDAGAVAASRRRHTIYWRDWSSDVCSSDLPRWRVTRARGAGRRSLRHA